MPAADMWALGCLLYTLCYCVHPFMNATQLQIVNANVRFPATVPGGQPVNPTALAIMQALLQQQVHSITPATISLAQRCMPSRVPVKSPSHALLPPFRGSLFYAPQYCSSKLQLSTQSLVDLLQPCRPLPRRPVSVHPPLLPLLAVLPPHPCRRQSTAPFPSSRPPRPLSRLLRCRSRRRSLVTSSSRMQPRPPRFVRCPSQLNPLNGRISTTTRNCRRRCRCSLMQSSSRQQAAAPCRSLRL